MNAASRDLRWARTHEHGNRQSFQDSVTYLTQLWRTFEESGAISAYIAYRMHLAHLSFGDRQHLTHWKSGSWQ
jgi:hypothetical protein